MPCYLSTYTTTSKLLLNPHPQPCSVRPRIPAPHTRARACTSSHARSLYYTELSDGTITMAGLSDVACEHASVLSDNVSCSGAHMQGAGCVGTGCGCRVRLGAGCVGAQGVWVQRAGRGSRLSFWSGPWTWGSISPLPHTLNRTWTQCTGPGLVPALLCNSPPTPIPPPIPPPYPPHPRPLSSQHHQRLIIRHTHDESQSSLGEFARWAQFLRL